jgi:16S rRNA (uracil1498-N3)-methyltransferase
LTAGRSLAGALREIPAADCAVLVGPEGGWAAAEEAALAAAGANPVTLGPRVLRADSAAPVALSIVQSVWGDLG